MPDEMPVAAKPTAVELAKIASNFLLGDIPKELADGAPGFGKPSIQLLKNHGTYQQDDREQRKSKEGAKSTREISFMIRTCVPGGRACKGVPGVTMAQRPWASACSSTASAQAPFTQACGAHSGGVVTPASTAAASAPAAAAAA